jgi:hypothetical protein
MMPNPDTRQDRSHRFDNSPENDGPTLDDAAMDDAASRVLPPGYEDEWLGLLDELVSEDDTEPIEDSAYISEAQPTERINTNVQFELTIDTDIVTYRVPPLIPNWMASLLRRPSEEVRDLAVDLYTDRIYQAMAGNFFKSNVSSAVFETVTNDLFIALALEHLCGKTKVDALARRIGSVVFVQLSQRLSERQNDPEFQAQDKNYQRGYEEGFLKRTRRAKSKSASFLHHITSTLGDILRKGAIGLFVNSLALAIGIGPIVQAMLGKVIDWFINLSKSRAWQESVADTPELKAEMEYRLGYAEGEAKCTRELLRLLDKFESDS